MTVTYKKGMLATVGGTPGMIISQYRLTGGGSEDGMTINAKDIGLSTIMSLGVNEEQLQGAPARHYDVGIGTFTAGKGDANYATVRAISAAGTTVTTLGTNMQVMAIGM